MADSQKWMKLGFQTCYSQQVDISYHKDGALWFYVRVSGCRNTSGSAAFENDNFPIVMWQVYCMDLWLIQYSGNLHLVHFVSDSASRPSHSQLVCCNLSIIHEYEWCFNLTIFAVKVITCISNRNMHCTSTNKRSLMKGTMSRKMRTTEKIT